ncbi:MAG: ATP synthase subunit C [Oscillospiraceae bacterium]|nr:ATP synthase subunit C [Oscillospiraceae bacterium]
MNILFAAFLLLFAVALPLYFIYRRAKGGKRGKAPLLINLFSFFGVIAFASVYLFARSALAAGPSVSSGPASSAALADGLQNGLTYIAAALAVGLSGIGGGVAVASSASAALGALSENDGILGKALIFVGMAEGVALYGLLIAFMILMG